jgi:hypothetical protein
MRHTTRNRNNRKRLALVAKRAKKAARVAMGASP